MVGDPRPEPVVVAVADLAGRDGVVLVHDWDGPHLEELRQGGARVEVAAALLRVGQRQQDLARRDAVVGQHLGPGARKRDLADRSGGLAVLQLERPAPEPEHAAPERDGARGHDQHVRLAAVQFGQVLRERREPGVVEPPAHPVHQQRGADLDDDAAELGKRGGHESADTMSVWAKSLPL
jgi:hypothetical protein